MSQRDIIQMTDDEVQEFLDHPRNLQLATIGPDGVPHLVTMFYAMFGERIGFWTYGKAQKVRNIERDERVSCLVEDGKAYEELRGVSIVGRAELVKAFDEVRAIGEKVYGRYNDTGEFTPELEASLDAQARKRVGVLVEPVKVVTWDHRKLAAAAAARKQQA